MVRNKVAPGLIGQRGQHAVTSAARKAYKVDVDPLPGLVVLAPRRDRDLATGFVTTVVFLVPDTATVRKIIGENAASMVSWMNGPTRATLKRIVVVTIVYSIAGLCCFFINDII